MTKSQARLLGVGLGALLFPACYGFQQPFVAEPAPVVVSGPTTVKRVAQPPTQAAPQPGQYVQVPTYERVIQYDQFGRPFERIGVDVNRQNATVANQPVPASNNPAAAITEPMEVVAITHTGEPPVAPMEMTTRPAPRQVAEKPTNTVTQIPTVVNAVPPFVAPGTQVLVLQPQSGTLQPVGATTTQSLQNLLTPPVPAEELKLVSVPKTPPMSPLMHAVKAYQDKSAVDAEKSLAHLDPANQQLLKRMLPMAVKLSETGLPSTNPAEVAEMAEQLQQMVAALRAKAELRLDKLCYCRSPIKPVRYGAYQPLPDDYVFRAGETVELYMELRNFSCEAKEKEYTTHLTTVIEVRDERNEVAARFEFERDRPDVGQAPRQEYFHICRFPVQGLAAGQYTLTAEVTDVPSGKSAKRSLPLRIESPRRVARGTAD